jgi:hypothetical protein
MLSTALITATVMMGGEQSIGTADAAQLCPVTKSTNFGAVTTAADPWGSS